ncbi:E3 SUMO-protein ligase ZBED1-like [Mercenaria mercenaria]|uniref:E3 SUMO-protein ligase ZBED1-like n=1 Tax=Mercenaria mercenaria TaxID=6596 RepID=UPI00234F210F|nr:E3 SUMO-protein ligase ZBED1-like [Mercenaria mercenaria]
MAEEEAVADFKIVEKESKGGKKSFVWKFFGFVETQGVINKKSVACKLCKLNMPYSGNITNLRAHLDRKHWAEVKDQAVPAPNVLSQTTTSASASTSSSGDPPLPSLNQEGQPTITHLFAKQKSFPNTSVRAVEITKAIADFLILDMKPLDTVEGEGFKTLMKVLEPRYSVILRNHLLERYIVPMYQNTVENVKLELSKGKRHAFTTDGWTSMSAESFITTTCHYIEPQMYQLHSKVLDTKYCPVNHTAENLSAEIKATVEKWDLKDSVSVTDNAANIVKACNLAQMPHFGCFGHILNLAVNRCLSVPEISSLLGKCRKLVSVFKQSSLKTTALHTTEANLELKDLQVIQDVETRWNSALMMIKRLLEILPAIWAVLYKDKKNSHLLPSDTDRNHMEDLKDLLQPVEEATKKVYAEKTSTVSLILPTMERFVKHDFVPKATDSSMIVKAKDAIRSDLMKRYVKDDEQQLLLTATALDPRFKKLQWLDQEKRNDVYSELKKDLINVEIPLPAVNIKSEPGVDNIKTETESSSEAANVTEESERSPQKKKTKQEVSGPVDEADFFDVLFVKEEKSEITKADVIDREFDGYMKEDILSLKQDPIE